ncbi:MAG: hypothetical protein GY906_33940 [bacterium]|nr:hypothetical protein [bacterium]
MAKGRKKRRRNRAKKESQGPVSTPFEQHAASEDLVGGKSTPPPSADQPSLPRSPVHERRRRALRVLVVVAGIFLGQAVLYGPSLTGQRLLLPLDLLKGTYLPDTDQYKDVEIHDRVLSDRIDSFVWFRRFAAAEVRQGRLPTWTPNIFAGAPFARFDKYCPFHLIYYVFPGPRTLAWVQLVLSLCAGLGAYAFFRVGLGARFFAALVGAWCYPLTFYFVLWQDYPTIRSVVFLPWCLLAVDRVVRTSSRFALWGLAGATSLTLLSGQLDAAGQVLMVSGLFAIAGLVWRLRGEVLTRKVIAPALLLVGGWVAGAAIASPYVLPLLEYARTGARIQSRAEGVEERPPGKLANLPLVLLPEAQGSTRRGSIFTGEGNLLESGAGAHAGLLAALLFAPLAFADPRGRRSAWFFLGLGVFGASWVLAIPGVVTLLRLPGLNLMSHNRLVFVTSFALLSLAVLGLCKLSRTLENGGRSLQWRWWMALPVAALVIFMLWCISYVLTPPEPFDSLLASELSAGRPLIGAETPQMVERVQRTFLTTHLAGAALCALSLAGWTVLLIAPRFRRWLLWVGGTLMVAELLFWGYGVNPQVDPSLNYPSLPALEGLAEREPLGRAIALGCLPARMLERFGLRDVRGYDAVDPANLVELLNPVRDARDFASSYAQLQWFTPTVALQKDGSVRLPPVMDMLGVRWIILREPIDPRMNSVVATEGYAVVENKRALPRVFVPRAVGLTRDPSMRVESLTVKYFDPRTLALVETPLSLPSAALGHAEVRSETPTHVVLSADMETAGLVVLGDRWDAGWSATLDGVPVEVLRVNHILRGVVVPAGHHEIVYRFRPVTLLTGVVLCLLAVSALVVFSALRRGTQATTAAGRAMEANH